MDGVNKAACLLQQTMITPCHFAGCFLAHSRGWEEGKRRGFRTGGLGFSAVGRVLLHAPLL